MALSNVVEVSIGRLPLMIVKSIASGKHKPILTLGAPGIGKSDCVAQAATAIRQHVKNYGFQETILSMYDYTDIRFPFLNGERMAFSYNPEFPLESNSDRIPPTGLWHIDELTNVEPSIQKSILQLVLNGKLGNDQLLSGWSIVASGNRTQDRTFSGLLSAALANRFTILHVVPNLDDWVKWAYVNEVEPLVIAFLKYKPDQIHNFNADLFSQGEMAFPSPRAWATVSNLWKMGMDKGDRLAMICGTVGSAAGQGFESFARVYEDLPDLDEICATGKGRIPKDVAVLIAVSTALVARATQKNIDNILKYSDGLPAEYQKLLAVDLGRRDPMLVTSEAYASWAVRHEKALGR